MSQQRTLSSLGFGKKRSNSKEKQDEQSKQKKTKIKKDDSDDESAGTEEDDQLKQKATQIVKKRPAPAAAAQAKPKAEPVKEKNKEPKIVREDGSDDGNATESDEEMKQKAQKVAHASPKAAPGKAVKPGVYSTKIQGRQTNEIVFQDHPNYNEKFTKILSQMETIQHDIGLQQKAKAYRKAVQALRNHPSEVKSGKEAQKLDGIGKKIAKKIDEIIETGKLRKLDKYLEDPHVKAILLFSRISGVGPVTAKKWVDDEGWRTLDDARKNSAKLNHQQKIGLQYFEDLETRIPREEMKLHEKLIREAAKKVDPKLVLQCVGSYRRGAPTSGDVDILITHPNFDESKKNLSKDFLSLITAELKKTGYITDDLSNGRVKYMGICKLPGSPDADKEGKEEGEKKASSYPHRHVDLRMFNSSHFPCAVLYFTGSDFFNVQMRLIALERGFTLNEYEIAKVGADGVKGDPIPVSNEEEIFKVLGMKYRKPEERNL